jgi:hypothetical protein
LAVEGMPKIQWERLPREKWAHLRDRARERQISEEDLFDLAEWKAQDPDVPDGEPLICGPNDFFVKPYAIGPVVDVNLPRGFSAEVGFLYERFHIDLAQGLTAPHGGAVNFGQKYSVSADGWLFPLLLKYTFGRPICRRRCYATASRPIRWQRHPIGFQSPAPTDFDSF